MRGIGWLLMVALGAGVLPGDAGAQTTRPLRVATFNLFHGGPWSAWGDDAGLDRRLAMVTRELLALDVDVIGLQEASEGRRRGNVAARLASALGHQHVFTSATSRILPLPLVGLLVRLVHGFVEGPAILSRFPIVSSAVHDLPRCRGFFNVRVLLEAELETPRGPLRVFSTHTAGDACQTRRVAEIVRERRGRLPSIVLGDFNAAAPSPAIAVLQDVGGFVDAFAVASPHAPGATVWQRPGAPDRTVTRRVDYVFLVPGTAVEGRALTGRVILDSPERDGNGNTLWPSDHYGLLAELDVFSSDAGRARRTPDARGPAPARPATPPAAIQ